MGVGGKFAEMALYRLPGTPGGDAHLLVVVAGRASGCEGVAQPEPSVLGYVVGDVREGGCALVGGHDQVWVVVVEADHVDGGLDAAPDQVVGQVEESGHEHPV